MPRAPPSSSSPPHLSPVLTGFPPPPPPGEIVTRVSLDRELKAVYEVTAEVHDEGRPPRHAHATVRVLVTDVNDNSPTFIEPREPSVSVREEQPAGTEVLQVSAGPPRPHGAAAHELSVH